MNLNEASLEKKLNSLVNTQDSIQSLSLWILHHKAHHKRIVQLWLKALEKGKTSHRLTLFYLANDVVQHAKKKNIPQYLTDYDEILRDAILLVRDEKIRPNINRVLNIWQERNIYPSDFVDELRSLLTGSSVRAANATKIVAEFKLSHLTEKIKRAKKVGDLTRERIEAVNATHIDALSKQVLNNLKDKSHGEQYSKEFEDATRQIELVVAALEKEIAVRTDLIEALEKSEIFYETQKGEAKIVANAYKNFAQRVKSVKKKLTESKTNLPSPLPSPSTDAPSPTNSDDGPQLPGAESPRSSRAHHESNGSQEVSSLDMRLSNLMQGMPLIPNSSTHQPSEPIYGHTAPITLPPALQAAIGINPPINSTNDTWPAVVGASQPLMQSSLQHTTTPTLQPPPPPPPPPQLPPIPNLGDSLNVLGIQQPPLPPPPPPPPPIMPNVGTNMLPQEMYPSYDFDYYHQLNSGVSSIQSSEMFKIEQGNEKVQPIQAVISSRSDIAGSGVEPYKPVPPVDPNIYEAYINAPNQPPHENFEPADMELGNSDDEEPISRPQSQRFLKIIETRTGQNDSDTKPSSMGPSSSADGHQNDSSNPSPQKQYGQRHGSRSHGAGGGGPSRHQHHSSRDNRNPDNRWMSPSNRPSSQYSGHSTNQYNQQNTGRHWKAPPPHNSRGSFSRRY